MFLQARECKFLFFFLQTIFHLQKINFIIKKVRSKKTKKSTKFRFSFSLHMQSTVFFIDHVCRSTRKLVFQCMIRVFCFIEYSKSREACNSVLFLEPPTMVVKTKLSNYVNYGNMKLQSPRALTRATSFNLHFLLILLKTFSLLLVDCEERRKNLTTSLPVVKLHFSFFYLGK